MSEGLKAVDLEENKNYVLLHFSDFLPPTNIKPSTFSLFSLVTLHFMRQVFSCVLKNTLSSEVNTDQLRCEGFHTRHVVISV